MLKKIVVDDRLILKPNNYSTVWPPSPRGEPVPLNGKDKRMRLLLRTRPDTIN